ncbi:hypothetical protein BC628DRAFT_908474 [Trametes gibbosa]|nr:hypothetical protein BC628DRAFT_908474 [Trametes gibbosa]
MDSRWSVTPKIICIKNPIDVLQDHRELYHSLGTSSQCPSVLQDFQPLQTDETRAQVCYSSERQVQKPVTIELVPTPQRTLHSQGSLGDSLAPLRPNSLLSPPPATHPKRPFQSSSPPVHPLRTRSLLFSRYFHPRPPFHDGQCRHRAHCTHTRPSPLLPAICRKLDLAPAEERS